MDQRLDQPERPSREFGDVVDAALATALQRASAAGDWAEVVTLARELEARKRARGETKPGTVIALDEEKRRRGR